MALRLAAETAKVIFETKPDKVGFLTIRADALLALALEWSTNYGEAFRAGRKEMREQSENACTRIEGDLGNEHADDCDCVTVVEDECSCHLSLFRKAVAALSLEKDE